LPLFLGAGLCFSLLDTTAKYLVRDHALVLIVWARYAGQMAVVTPWAWRRGGHGFWRSNHLALQLVRSALLVTATLSFFAALRFLPIAEASAITFIAPVFVVLLSPWMLGERLRRSRLVAALAGFAGILILLRPGSSILHPSVSLLFLTALSSALFLMLTRKLTRDGGHTTLFYSGLVGTLVLAPFVPAAIGAGAWSPRDWVLFALLGALAGIGHAFLTRALSLAPPSLLAPFTYMQILWATAAGYLVFDHWPDGWSFVGMAVIVASGLALAWQERRRARAALRVP